jgi:rSAM/selenodomain-associated transferase 1
MAAAFEWAFAQGARRVVLVGTDVPELAAGHLDEAISALARHDVVLGPATDGGYYLIALRKPVPALFSAMEWSTPGVFAETKKRAEEGGLAVHVLPALSDIDTIEDVRRDWPSLKAWLPQPLAERLEAKLSSSAGGR